MRTTEQNRTKLKELGFTQFGEDCFIKSGLSIFVEDDYIRVIVEKRKINYTVELHNLKQVNNYLIKTVKHAIENFF